MNRGTNVDTVLREGGRERSKSRGSKKQKHKDGNNSKNINETIEVGNKT
jgi:hypothetical protein